MKIRLFLLLVCLPLLGISQSKNEKFLKKAEASYATGDYEKAFKYLEKFRKKVNKKLGTPNQYTPVYYLSYARYNLASGMIVEFESNLQSAITAINQASEKNEKSYQLLIDAANLQNQNGSFLKARLLLDDVKKQLEAASLLKDPLAAKWDLAYAEAIAGQGYYNQAIEILKERQPFFAGRANKSETSVVDGALKSRKLSDDEYKERVAEYSRALILLAKTLGDKGEFNEADPQFIKNEQIIRKALDRYSIEYITNKYYWANNLVNHGLEKSLENAIEDDYGTLLTKLKANHKPTHWLATKLYEAQLRIYLRDESSRYYNLKLEYEKLINREFKSTSIYGPRLKALEFDSKLSRDKTSGLENSALNLLNNNKALPKANEVTVQINEFLAELAIFQKKFTNAELYLRSAIDIKKELLGEDAPATHLSRVLYANYLVDYTNNITEAGKIYQDSFTKVVEKEIGADQENLLDILNHVATLYEMSDRYAEANATLEKAKNIANIRFDPKHWQYAIALTNIARLEIKTGEYEKAEADVAKAIEVMELKENRADNLKVYLINAVETQAVLFGIKGLFDDAEDNLQRSSKIIGKAGHDLVGLDELATARELSSLLIQLGRYSETESLLNNMITEYEKQYGKTSLRLIDPLVNLGRLTMLNGDYTEADKIAIRANEIAVKIYGEVSTKTAPTQKLLADIDNQIGDYDNAKANIERALKSQEKQFGRNHIEVAKCLSQLAIIKFHKGDDKKEVEKMMLESREIMGNKLGKDNPQYAEILKNVAILYISERKFDIAFSSLTQAEQIWRSKTGRKRNINAASIYALTGDVFYQQKNYVKAEEFYNKAKDLYERFFNKNHPEYVKLLAKQAKVYYMEKDYKRAKRNIEEALGNYEEFIKRTFPALSEREKAKYWATMKEDFEFYNTLAFSQLEDFRDLSGKVYNYQLLTKALLLNNTIKTRERILNSKDENLISLYNEWLEKKEYLTSVLSMSTQQLTDNGINPAALGTEIESLERQLSEKSELFAQGFESKKITYENVQKSLSKSEIAMEIVRYRNFNHSFTDSVVYVGLYVRNDNARPKVITMKEGYRMENRWMKYYRNCITGKIPDQYSYKIFWEPIKNEIGTYTAVYISPDGVYNQINLEAIPTPDGKYVIDDSNIVIVSNTKDLYIRKQKAKLAGGASTNSATMFGNPTYYLSASAERTIAPLPGTDIEVRGIDEMLKQGGWKTAEYLEAEASEEQVKQVDSPNVLHIATHGFYTPEIDPSEFEKLTESEAQLSENPLLKTGLLLKGAGDVFAETKYNYNLKSGILTASEAMNLNLDKTDLVVLSACETGLGDIHFGEGVMGLQRAFLVAGAKTLIISMFRVDDNATQKLIRTFYSKWLATKNARQSFIDAKKEVRTEFPEPYYWGAFMMIGLDAAAN
ncbi:MAG TPA: CHAT domain-containing tetratricopeptide repeat protein [Cyclobacteriaceae bacterium]|nr:CHAT domain-containing tetratricopeptide repeat protein [Cyclobacteriaceae bacterium]